jgi:hypothetical protein
MNGLPSTIFCPVDWDYITLHAYVEMVYSIRCQRNATFFKHISFQRCYRLRTGRQGFHFSTPDRCKRFLFSRKIPDRHCGLPSLLFHRYEQGFSKRWCDQRINVNIQLHLMTSLRMSGTVIPVLCMTSWLAHGNCTYFLYYSVIVFWHLS